MKLLAKIYAGLLDAKNIEGFHLEASNSWTSYSDWFLCLNCVGLVRESLRKLDHCILIASHEPILSLALLILYVANYSYRILRLMSRAVPDYFQSN